MPPLDQQEQCAWRHFLAMQRQLMGQLGRRLQREAGLSFADYEILGHLVDSPAGRMRSFEIGRLSQWEKSRLSHQLSRMQQRGLVERQVCTKDPRYSEVVLTEEGRDAFARASDAYGDDVRQLFVEALTPQQLLALTEISQAVVDRIEKSCGEEC